MENKKKQLKDTQFFAFFLNLLLETDLFFFNDFAFLWGKIQTFSTSYSITLLLTKLFGKKYFFASGFERSYLNASFIYFCSFWENFKVLQGKLNVSLLKTLSLSFRSQGWLFIYLIPFKEPILWSGSFVNNPFINYFNYLEIWTYFGNLGSEFIIETNISYFFEA